MALVAEQHDAAGKAFLTQGMRRPAAGLAGSNDHDGLGAHSRVLALTRAFNVDATG